MDASNNISYCPIIEYANGGFQAWNGASFEVLGLPTGLSYDTFATVQFTIDAANNQTLFNIAGLTHTVASAGTVALDNIIIPGINTDAGVDRTLYFDNLRLRRPAAALSAATPPAPRAAH